MTDTHKLKAMEFAHQQAMQACARDPEARGVSRSDVLETAKAYEKYLDGTTEREEKARVSFGLAAAVAHEAIRSLQIANDEEGVALPWHEVSKDIRESCIIGVRRVYDNPDITVEELHDSWVNTKTEQGWTYGPVRNAELKQHHCLVPYDQLTPYDKSKDLVFLNVVKAALGI